jgi:DNA-directed RNA polymerase subunit beta
MLLYTTHFKKDPTNSEKEAVEHIYRQLRNAEPPDEETG